MVKMKPINFIDVNDYQRELYTIMLDNHLTYLTQILHSEIGPSNENFVLDLTDALWTITNDNWVFTKQRDS